MTSSSSSCAFCAIAKTYPPTESHVPSKPDSEAMQPNCFLILSSEHVLAFLDIMPIAEGHLLVIPRTHREKLADLKGSEGASLGVWLPLICRAVMRYLGREGGDWNVVQNNGASAAQVVPHVHYHIIPRGGKIPDERAKSWTMFGRGQRDDLHEDDGVKIAAGIREELVKELQGIADQDVDCWKLLNKL